MPKYYKLSYKQPLYTRITDYLVHQHSPNENAYITKRRFISNFTNRCAKRIQLATLSTSRTSILLNRAKTCTALKVYSTCGSCPMLPPNPPTCTKLYQVIIWSRTQNQQTTNNEQNSVSVFELRNVYNVTT